MFIKNKSHFGSLSLFGSAHATLRSTRTTLCLVLLCLSSMKLECINANWILKLSLSRFIARKFDQGSIATNFKVNLSYIPLQTAKVWWLLLVHSRVSESPFYPELTVKSIHLAAGAIHYRKLKTFLLLQSQVLVIENLKAVLSCVIPGTCITNSNNLDIINWCKVSWVNKTFT